MKNSRALKSTLIKSNFVFLAHRTKQEIMEVFEALGSRSHSFSLFRRAPISSTEHPHNHFIPISPKLSGNTTLSVAAKKKLSIEGLSEELTTIASLNLDFAPSRRRVRAAFTEVHQQLDHFLFKVSSHQFIIGFGCSGSIFQIFALLKNHSFILIFQSLFGLAN